MATAGRRGILVVSLTVLLLALGAGSSVLVTQAVGLHTLGTPAEPDRLIPSGSDDLMAWLARILLLLTVLWIVIGILAARTSLVRRPGAAAARASWLAATRPWRARESTLGMLALDRWLLFVVPAALLVATRAVQTSLLGWTRLLVVIGAWTVFALVLRIAVRGRSPWPVIAAVGGVVVLRCVLTLAALSFAGPEGYWYAFWKLRVAREVYGTLAFALFLWVFVAAAWSLIAQLCARRAVGAVLCAMGAALALPAFVVGVVGIEHALSVWSDRSGLLPWGLSRILAVTVQIDIPDAAVWWAVAGGLVMCAAGAVLTGRRRAVRSTVIG